MMAAIPPHWGASLACWPVSEVRSLRQASTGGLALANLLQGRVKAKTKITRKILGRRESPPHLEEFFKARWTKRFFITLLFLLSAGELRSSLPSERKEVKEFVSSCLKHSKEERVVLVDAFLDEKNLLPLSPERQPHKVALVAIQREGYGDLIFAAKLARIIKALFPQAELSLITYCSSFEKAKRIFGKEYADLIDKLIPIPWEENKEDSFDLLIQGPVNEGEEWKLFTKNPTKVLKLAEYGYFVEAGLKGMCEVDGPSFYSCGLGEGEMGIFNDPTLFHAVPSHPVDRLKILDSLEAKELTQLIFNKREAEKYCEECALYFGYSYNLSTQYIATVIAASDPSRNIDICLVGQEPLESANSNHSVVDELELFIKGNQEAWLKQNIEKVKVIDQKGEVHELVLGQGALDVPKREVRLFLLPPLPHADMIRLWQASEPFTLCTGDQSLSEVISLSKIFMYETLPHKEGLKKGLLKVAAPFGEVAAFLSTDDPLIRASYLKKKEFSAQFSNYLTHIVQNFNLENRLKGKINRILRNNRKAEIGASCQVVHCTQKPKHIEWVTDRLTEALPRY